MSTYDAVTDLPLTIESCELEPLELRFTEEFTRMTTLVRLRGDGQDGVGEDVTYDGLDHVALQAAGAPAGLAGPPPGRAVSRRPDQGEPWARPPGGATPRGHPRPGFGTAAAGPPPPPGG